MKTFSQMIIISLLLPASCGENKPTFDNGSAFEYLVKQAEFGPRNPGSEGHRNTLQYLRSKFAEFADSVRLQGFTHVDSASSIEYGLTNIIASFNLDLEKRVLLGAHWDTRPRSDHDLDPLKRNLPLLGANDGASGVAVLLELANVLNEHPPKLGADIVLFDGEDFGEEGDLARYFLGSRYFAQNYFKPKPEWALIVDMVGDTNLEIPIERYSYEANKNLVNRVWSAAERVGAKQFKKELGSYIQDDHLMLQKFAGINAIIIIDMDYVQGGMNIWHTSHDTPERCSPESLGAVGRTLIEMIY